MNGKSVMIYPERCNRLGPFMGWKRANAVSILDVLLEVYVEMTATEKSSYSQQGPGKRTTL
jgi:hypothetical protein